MDRRDHPRVDICLPCHISWVGGGAAPSVAVTENISRRGALIRWTDGMKSTVLPPVGKSVELAVDLPENPRFGARCMHCLGTVVRVILSEEGAAYVGLTLDQIRIRKLESGAVPLKGVSAAEVAAGWCM